MSRRSLFLALFLTACTTAPVQQAPAPAPKPAPVTPAPTPTPTTPVTKPAGLESTCPKPGVYGAVDLSQAVTQRFLDAARYLGVKTIIRYYEYDQETIRGKMPRAAELALIKKNGFQFMGVFQHNNSSMSTFRSATRGTDDAKRSVELSKLWGMPQGAAIYFGVDLDTEAADLPYVKAYFQKAAPIVRAAGFKVGVYGSGRTITMLLDAGLIDYSWLSMSTGFGGTAAFTASNKWHLKQAKDQDCGGINVDFDMVNPAFPTFGQWSLP